MDVSITRLKKLIPRFYKMKLPLFIHGAPGIGKSDAVRQASKEIAKAMAKQINPGVDMSKLENYYCEGIAEPGKFNLIDTRASQLDPTDARGIPFNVNGKTKYLPPNWLPTEGFGIIFFDEMNLAIPTVQHALYQLILDRRCGDYVLPEGYVILAAGNRKEDQVNVFQMPPPLKNRFAHVTLLPPSLDEWTKWAFDNGIRTEIIAFHQFSGGEYLYKFDKATKTDAFPTHRSWAKSSVLTNHIKYDIPVDKEYEEKLRALIDDDRLLVATCIGEAVAMPYVGFLELRSSIDLKGILEDPKKVKEIRDQGHRYILMCGLAETYKQKRANEERQKALNKIFNVVLEMEDKEWIVFLLKMMKNMHPNHFSDDLGKCGRFKEIYPIIGRIVIK